MKKIPLKVKWVVLPIFEIVEDEMVFKEADIYLIKRKETRKVVKRNGKTRNN